jgi:hypothetical protein
MAEAGKASGKSGATASALPLPESLAGNFQDAARWFGQLWGAAADAAGAKTAAGPIPAMMMPTMDIKEIDKRIADLRSVEHWLDLNLALLRTTVQGLEMQRNTLQAWQSLSAGAAAGGSAAAAGAAAPAPQMPEMPAFQPAAWWSALQQQFAQMAASAAAQAAAPAAKPAAADKPAAGKSKS